MRRKNEYAIYRGPLSVLFLSSGDGSRMMKRVIAWGIVTGMFLFDEIALKMFPNAPVPAFISVQLLPVIYVGSVCELMAFSMIWRRFRK